MLTHCGGSLLSRSLTTISFVVTTCWCNNRGGSWYGHTATPPIPPPCGSLSSPVQFSHHLSWLCTLQRVKQNNYGCIFLGEWYTNRLSIFFDVNWEAVFPTFSPLSDQHNLFLSTLLFLRRNLFRQFSAMNNPDEKVEAEFILHLLRRKWWCWLFQKKNHFPLRRTDIKGWFREMIKTTTKILSWCFHKRGKQLGP